MSDSGRYDELVGETIMTCQDVNFLYELMQKHLKNIYEKYLGDTK